MFLWFPYRKFASTLISKINPARNLWNSNYISVHDEDFFWKLLCSSIIPRRFLQQFFSNVLLPIFKFLPDIGEKKFLKKIRRGINSQDTQVSPTKSVFDGEQPATRLLQPSRSYEFPPEYFYFYYKYAVILLFINIKLVHFEALEHVKRSLQKIFHQSS